MNSRSINPRHYKYMGKTELEAVAQGLLVIINHTSVTAYRVDAQAKFNGIRRNLWGRGYDLNPQGQLIENR